MERIPSLDGLRAVSILLVVVAHTCGAFFVVMPNHPAWAVVANGALGVEVFFVLSGYLITTLLLAEHEETGTIRLRDFYLRRVFRIVPPFYLYVLTIAAIALFTPSVARLGDILSALTFTWNYSPYGDSWALGHSWSLSVEEQFYLFWPASLLAVLARGGRRAAAKLALALLLAAPLLRVASHASGLPLLTSRLYVMLHTRVDALMFGCLAAILSGTPLLERVLRAASRWVGLLAAFLLVASPLLARRFGGAYLYVIGYSLEGASITILMLWLIRNDRSWIGRLLNARPVVHIGLISYSLYIWQELFLHPDNRAAFGQFPLNVGAAFAAAELSYRFVERPSLALRARYFERRSAPTATRA